VPGPGAFSAPSVAQVGNSSVIAAEGPGNSLNFYYQPIGASGWTPETAGVAGTTFSAPSVAQVGSSSVISAAGPDGSLDFYYQPIGAVPWHCEQVTRVFGTSECLGVSTG
jgi:hypothetical protein